VDSAGYLKKRSAYSLPINDATQDSLNNIYTQSQVDALLLTKQNVSDTSVKDATKKWVLDQGYTTVGGTGTVTSVALGLPSQFTVSGSPVTTSGTLTAIWADTTQRVFFAGPVSGNGKPRFRGLFSNDIPTLGIVKVAYLQDSITKLTDSLRVHRIKINKLLDSLTNIYTQAQVTALDSLVKQGIRTEYINHDSTAKQTIRTEFINHDSTVIQDFRVDMINHDTLDRTTIRGEYINHDSIVQQYARIRDAILQDSLDKHTDTLQSHDERIKALVAKSEIITFFGCGVDTLSFSTVTKYPAGYSSGIIIDTVIYIATTIGAGTVNVTPKLFYGSDIEASGTAIISSPSAVTSHTGVTRISAFDNATVAKGNMVWLTFTSTTTIPRNFCVIIMGHRN